MPSPQIAHWSGTHTIDQAYVYWPFLVHRLGSSRNWTITHAMTGYYVDFAHTKREAVSLVRILRPVTD